MPTAAETPDSLTRSLDDTDVKPVLLMIADISGYTDFMVRNAKSLAHGQAIISQLVGELLREIRLPLIVAKLEGDAIFFYARRLPGPRGAEHMNVLMGDKLVSFFELFSRKVNQMVATTTCRCPACQSMRELRLKIIVHSGEAVFHQMGRHEELAGVDVILLHRLLKNSVDEDEYLLMTEAALNDIRLPWQIELTEGEESYPGLGTVKTFALVFDDNDKPLQERCNTTIIERPTFWKNLCNAMTLWFSQFGLRNRRKNHYHHLESESTAFGRSLLAVFTILLTPIYFPVAVVFSLKNAMKQRRSRAAFTS